MYLPKSHYTGPLNTPEGVYVRQDGTPFKGWFFVTYDGKAFEGLSPLEAKEQLKLKVVYDAEQKVKELESFPTYTLQPSERNYKQGTVTRYFIKRKNNQSIAEVNLDTFNSQGTAPYYSRVRVIWNLTGPVEDTTYGSYTIEGAASKNKKALERAELSMKGISEYLTDLGEFVK